MTRKELEQQAKDLGIKNVSKMNMVELQKAIDSINDKGEVIVEKEKVILDGKEIEIEGSLEEMDDFMAGADAGTDGETFVPKLPGASDPSTAPAPSTTPADANVCAHCGTAISAGVANYCKKNYPDKAIACMPCQKKLGYSEPADYNSKHPLCPNCKERHITPVIANFCKNWYPGKTPVCMACQKVLKYVPVKQVKVNTPATTSTANTINCVCSTPGCGRTLSEREVKFNTLNGLTNLVCFSHAEVKAVLSFNRDETKPYYTSTPAPAAAITTTTTAPISTGTGVHCDFCNKELSQGVINRNHNLWINRPEYEDIHVCANCLIEKGLLQDSMKK